MCFTFFLCIFFPYADEVQRIQETQAGNLSVHDKSGAEILSVMNNDSENCISTNTDTLHSVSTCKSDDVCDQSNVAMPSIIDTSYEHDYIDDEANGYDAGLEMMNSETLSFMNTDCEQYKPAMNTNTSSCDNEGKRNQMPDEEENTLPEEVEDMSRDTGSGTGSDLCAITEIMTFENGKVIMHTGKKN